MPEITDSDRTMGEIRQIPYGITDFERIRTENYYYVDKTRFISMIERAASYVFLLRPRRFGKSLLTNVLAAYYDVNSGAYPFAS